jgi:hypothetical protein
MSYSTEGLLLQRKNVLLDHDSCPSTWKVKKNVYQSSKGQKIKKINEPFCEKDEVGQSMNNDGPDVFSMTCGNTVNTDGRLSSPWKTLSAEHSSQFTSKGA